MGGKNLVEVGTSRTERVLAELGLPSAPQKASENQGRDLATRSAPYCPSGRMIRMKPNQGDRAGKSEPDGKKDPVWELTPVRLLNPPKSVSADELPRAKYIHLVRPDCSDVIERQSQIQEKKCSRVH